VNAPQTAAGGNSAQGHTRANSMALKAMPVAYARPVRLDQRHTRQSGDGVCSAPEPYLLTQILELGHLPNGCQHAWAHGKGFPRAGATRVNQRFQDVVAELNGPQAHRVRPVTSSWG
jgi:hypothetical protein